ncbi:hypothetical protein GCM10022267_35950 [Lentzea roselyniae]|uniref:Alpha-L-arabinofuranosidase B arabinose-binding domain-containing protein n=1 Tax=Lentzea roselyniae TaxID=531940 RepID=A0ABP7B2T2_9PSEU
MADNGARATEVQHESQFVARVDAFAPDFAQTWTTLRLASSSWSSFQSYNHPDRYIRHYAYELRLAPITTAVSRSDATFRVTS